MIPPRILRKIVKQEDGCWIWAGSTSKWGYGQTWFDGKPIYTHVLMCKLHNGDIPLGYQVDHLCKVKNCCNPAHLEAVSRSINMQRGPSWHHVVEKYATATHCKRGHEWSVENTYTEPNGKRRCRKCKVARLRRHRECLIAPVEEYL